jgi:hypothetical protein
MPEIASTAHFSPADPLPRMLEDLACPSCGHQDPGCVRSQMRDYKLRIFCECCGAFVSISLTSEQADALTSRVLESSTASPHRDPRDSPPDMGAAGPKRYRATI